MSNEPQVPSDQAPRDSSRLWLSALADGQADAAQPGCRLWRDDGDARATWHLYHLIGDVLRSDELAQAPARDAAFLAGLRSRLAAEPVPLSPPAPDRAPDAAAPEAAAPRAARRHLGWRAPAAVAAGFAAVGVALVLTRAPASGPALAPLGGAATPGMVMVDTKPSLPAAVPAGTPQIVLSGDLLRDARLDAYLRAHQAARGNAAAALPGGGLRSVEMLVTPLPAERAAAGGPR
jgi:sigma-E factor negative regulatory protein RseA